MSYRKIDYLNRNRIIYNRDPINDKPTKTFTWGKFYEYGTYECYELFKSKAKINSFKSLKWHLLVLKYLNPELEDKDFKNLAYYITNKKNIIITRKRMLTKSKKRNISRCSNMGCTFN